MPLTTGSGIRAVETASCAVSVDGAPFLLPAAGRVVAGAGLPGGPIPKLLRRHGAVARRIMLGRQIRKIVGRDRPSD